MDLAIIEEGAMRLPDGERAILADRLLSSLAQTSKETRAAWVQEADARMEAYREGKLDAVDGPEALAKLKERFAK